MSQFVSVAVDTAALLPLIGELYYNIQNVPYMLRLSLFQYISSMKQKTIESKQSSYILFDF